MEEPNSINMETQLIQVKVTTAKKIKSLRLAEKESYDEIINRILDFMDEHNCKLNEGIFLGTTQEKKLGTTNPEKATTSKG